MSPLMFTLIFHIMPTFCLMPDADDYSMRRRPLIFFIFYAMPIFIISRSLRAMLIYVLL